MIIPRFKTLSDSALYEGIRFVEVSSRVSDGSGQPAFSQDGMTVPAGWGQIAIDILAKKYFRKSGIAKVLRKIEEHDVPSWLWRSVPDTEAMRDWSEADRYGGEVDARAVFGRIAGA